MSTVYGNGRTHGELLGAVEVTFMDITITMGFYHQQWEFHESSPTHMVVKWV